MEDGTGVLQERRSLYLSDTLQGLYKHGDDSYNWICDESEHSSCSGCSQCSSEEKVSKVQQGGIYRNVLQCLPMLFRRTIEDHIKSYEKLCKSIPKLVKEAGLKQTDVIREMGINKSTWHRRNNTEIPWSTEELMKLVEVMEKLIEGKKNA